MRTSHYPQRLTAPVAGSIAASQADASWCGEKQPHCSVLACCGWGLPFFFGSGERRKCLPA